MACCCGVDCQDCCGTNCAADPALQGKRCNQIAIRVRMDIPSPGSIDIDIPLPPAQNAGDGSFTVSISGLSGTFDCVTETNPCVFLPVGSLNSTGLLYMGDLTGGAGGLNCDNGTYFLLQISSLFRITVLDNCTYRMEAQHLAPWAGFKTVQRDQENARFPFSSPGYGYFDFFGVDWKTPPLQYGPQFNNSINALRSAAVISDTTATCVKDLVGVSVSQSLFNNSGDITSTQGGRCSGGTPVSSFVPRPPNTTVTWTITDVFLRA